MNRRRPRIRMVSRRRPVLASMLLLGVGIALAAPGNLDPGFGDDGLLRLQIGGGGPGADPNAVLQQSDSKLVLVGFGNIDGRFDEDFLAVRLNGDGAPDPTFSTDGIATADRAGGRDVALAAIQQPDGKLVLAGYTYAGNQGIDIALARFNVDGTLDLSFGDSGWAILDLGGASEGASGLIHQPGGKLVIAGYSNSSGSFRAVFARFNPDGALDSTFGTGGTTWIDFGGGSENWANDLVAQPDGKLVAGGAVYGPGLRFDMAIARVTANGIPDAGFDSDGLLFVDFDDLGEQARSVAMQPDGAIVAAGYTVPVSDGYFKLALLRVRGDGSLDGTFGTGGKSVVDLGTQADLSSIVVQPDGKLAATGSLLTSYFYPDAILARFQSNGALDTSFGNAGIAIADFGEQENGPWSIGFDLIQQADGKLLAATSVSGSFVGAARFDDSASYPGRIGLTNTFESVVEETATSVTYTVRRSGGKSGAVSVGYATVAGRAQPGSDFVPTSGMLDWNDGDTSDRSITIDLRDDQLVETPEDFSLVLSNPTGGARLAASEATTNIQNRDGPGQLGFFFLISFFGRTLNAEEINRIVTLPVNRINGLDGAVSVQYAISGGSASAGSDVVVTPGTLTWADDEVAPKSISVEILEDSVLEGTECVDIGLSSPTGGAVIDRRFATYRICIRDDERGFRLTSSTVPVGESGGSVTLAVERIGAATGAASVNYATESGSATAGSDFTAASGTLDWADGDSASRNVVINIASDTADENNETFTVTLSNPTGGLMLGTNATATVTITDDDASGGGSGSSSGGGGGGGGGGANGLVELLLALGALFAARRPTALGRQRTQ